MPFAVYAPGLAVFAMGSTEILIAGVLPETASTYGVSIPTAGPLASVSPSAC